MRSLILLGCLCASGAFAAPADPLEAALAGMDRAASKFKDMSADLREVAHTAVINEDAIESGKILMKRGKPGETRILVSFTDPDPKMVQIQGDTLDMFLPKSLTVQEYNLGKNQNQIEQFLLLGFGTTRQELSAANTIRYMGAETLEGVSAAHLELIPKSKEVRLHIQKIELWLNPETGYPLQHKLFQLGGDYTLFVFSNLKINAGIPDASLKLKLPKGVKKEFPQR